MRLGELVAAGRTSDVYQFGVGAVVKVPRPNVPDHWARLEADFTAAIGSLSVSAPRVIDVTEVDGRAAIVFEQIDGPTMWQQMCERPDRIGDLSVELAACHRAILSAGPPEGLDGLVDRMLRKLDEVEQISPDERLEAIEVISALPRGAALLHGDLHPGNVLMASDGPIAIDWFDATIGHPVADVVRSSLLMRPLGDHGDPSHLPDADVPTLRQLHDVYVDAMSDVLTVPARELGRWEAVVAVSRLAEGVQPDGPALMDIWRSRRHLAGPLFEALSRS